MHIGELTRAKKQERLAGRLKVITLCILEENKNRILIRKQICLHFSSLYNGEKKIKFASMYRKTDDVIMNPDMLPFTSVSP